MGMVFPRGEEETVVGMDFDEAVFLGAGEVEGIGGVDARRGQGVGEDGFRGV